LDVEGVGTGEVAAEDQELVVRGLQATEAVALGKGWFNYAVKTPLRLLHLSNVAAFGVEGLNRSPGGLGLSREDVDDVVAVLDEGAGGSGSAFLVELGHLKPPILQRVEQLTGVGRSALLLEGNEPTTGQHVAIIDHTGRSAGAPNRHVLFCLHLKVLLNNPRVLQGQSLPEAAKEHDNAVFPLHRSRTLGHWLVHAEDFAAEAALLEVKQVDLFAFLFDVEHCVLLLVLVLRDRLSWLIFHLYRLSWCILRRGCGQALSDALLLLPQLVIFIQHRLKVQGRSSSLLLESLGHRHYRISCTFSLHVKVSFFDLGDVGWKVQELFFLVRAFHEVPSHLQGQCLILKVLPFLRHLLLGLLRGKECVLGCWLFLLRLLFRPGDHEGVLYLADVLILLLDILGAGLKVLYDFFQKFLLQTCEAHRLS